MVAIGRLALLLVLILVTSTDGVTANTRPAAAGAGEASGPAGVSCPADGTRRPDLPGARASLAGDIAVVAGRPRWIVGTHAGQGRPRRPWILSNTGSGWREVPAASAGPDGGLVAVDSTRSLAWAVGFHASGRFLRPVAQRWTGGGWSAVSVPSSSRTEALVDVAIDALGTPWAVGYRTTGRGPRPVALAYRAGRWQRLDPWLPAGTFGALTSVDAAGDGTVWAVGWQGTGGALRPIVLRRDQGGWTRLDPPFGPADQTFLTGVAAVSRGAARVTGQVVRGADRKGLVWSFRDGSWSADSLVAAIPGFVLVDGIDIDRSGRVAISGSAWVPTRVGYAGFVAIRTADGWRTTRAPDGIAAPSHLRTVAWAGGDAWAIGWTGREGVADIVCDPSGLQLIRTRERASSPVGVRGSRQQPRQGPRAPRAERAPDGATPSNVRFRDVASAVGLGMWTDSYGGLSLDIDSDGWTDLLLSRHTERGRLLRNRRGTFVPAAGDPLPATDRHGCAAADIDRDGRPEAYCAVGAARGAKMKTNELWLDLDGRSPQQRAAPWGVDDTLGRGDQSTFADLDGDRWPDLVVTSDPLRVDGLPSTVHAFRNRDGAGFEAATQLGLELPVGGLCAIAENMDRAGTDEILICTEEPWGSAAGLHVFRQSGGRYRDVTTALGIRPEQDLDAGVADLDGDGRPDLVQLSSGRLAISLQRDGRFQRVARISLASGTALGIGDADGDGDQDLYVVSGGSVRDRLLLNRGDGRSWRDASIPQARGGSGDDVLVLDHDRNGTDDFLVLNGRHGSGPVQLIAGFR